MNRSPLRRHTPLKLRRRRTIGSREQRERFRRATLFRTECCPVVDDGPCEGPLEAHHVIPQQAIRKWARAAHVGSDVLADALWDPGNGLAVCRRHHDRHTRAVCRLPVSAIPATSLVFARALGLEHLLARYYRDGAE